MCLTHVIYIKKLGDMLKHKCRILLLLLVFSLHNNQANSHTLPYNNINTLFLESELVVNKIWSGHPVGISLYTIADKQFVAFYDAERRLTVGRRATSSNNWKFVKLPEIVGWDSHNYITLGIDNKGFLHLCANMHASTLVYFRTENPFDINSFRRVPKMVGLEEQKCTYPRFFTGPNDSFMFTYRSGGSGDGDQILNVYDYNIKKWRRLLGKPLLSGMGKGNAYPVGPQLGPDGYFHLAWVWRDTPDASTNHDLCYARSKDLVHWVTTEGVPLTLPLNLESCEIVDPVPVKKGLLNNIQLGFDLNSRLIISYTKYDSKGMNQIYNARWYNGKWLSYQTTDWQYRWEFGGGGTLPSEFLFGPIISTSDRQIGQNFYHVKYGSGVLFLNGSDLKVNRTMAIKDFVPERLLEPTTTFPGMQVEWSYDQGQSKNQNEVYLLRWETLGVNRDQKRTGTLPPPQNLMLYKFRKKPVTDALIK
jgi:hypothetical protein